MPNFLTDTFSAPDGTSLTSHAPDVGGAWSLIFGTSPQIVNNKLIAANSGGLIAVNSAVPTSADYQVQVDFQAIVASAVGGGSYGIIGRWVDSSHFYEVRYDAATTLVSLIAGTSGGVLIGSQVAQAVTVGSWYTLQLKMSGSTISALFGPQGGTLTQTTSVTDTNSTAAGKAGIFEGGASVSANTWPLDNLAAGSLVSAGPTTGYTLTAANPAIGVVGFVSNNFTVQSNGNLSTSVTITPTVSGITGTFNPTSATLAAGTNTSASFTFNPSTAGTGTVSTTNSSTLTNPASVGFVAMAAPATIGVASAARLQSPGNWSGDTGRSGSSYRQSWTPGAWATYVWSTTSSSPTATLLLTNATVGSTISYLLNGKLTTNVAVPTSGGITISGATTGTNTLTYFLRQSVYTTRWNLTNAFRDSGLTVDAQATAGTAPVLGSWVLDIGDSLKEGVQANNGADDYLSGYSYGVSRALDTLGYTVGVSASGFSGWLRPGGTNGDVPAYYLVTNGVYSASASRWNRIDASNSLLDANGHISAYGATGTEPALIYINYGTNEALQSSNTSDLQLSIRGALAALRTAAPAAWIVVAAPFGLYNTAMFANGLTYINAIKAAVAAYQAANPTDIKTVLLDLGANVSYALASTSYGASVHPNIAGNAYVAPQVTQFLIRKLVGSSGGIKRASFGGGF